VPFVVFLGNRARGVLFLGALCCGSLVAGGVETAVVLRVRGLDGSARCWKWALE